MRARCILDTPLNKAAIVLLSIVLLSSCTATKFLKEGESFYTGATIKLNPQGKISGQSDIKDDLASYITPEPSGSFLGMRPGVWFYYAAGTPKKKKGLRNFIKTKLGKPPVLLSDATPQVTAQSLQGQLNNEGYFKSKVKAEVITNRKKSHVVYTVDLTKPYTIDTIHYIFLDSAHARLVDEIKKNSLLKQNQKYSLSMLSAEQQRIEEVAQNAGFYYFDDRYLLFKADTTVGNRSVELDLTIEPGMPERAKRIYSISEITVYPNYLFTNDSLQTTSDTVMVDGFRYIDNQHNFRPHIITDVINLKPDSTYRKINHEYTLSHLMGLKTFKYVNIKYQNIRRDSTGLRLSVFLTPLLKKSLRAQVQGVSKSNNFVGPGVELTFTNRNLFRGAEMYQFKLSGAYEVQINSKQSNPLNAIEFAAENSLAVPRFITPFNIRSSSMKYLPQTQFKVGYSFQQRLQYFRLNSFMANVGYVWRETTLKTHELFPVEITYVKTGDQSEDFKKRLEENPALRNSFQDQFILGLRYGFTLNTQLSDDIEAKFNIKKTRKSNFYFNGTIELSGNIPNALQNAFNVEKIDTVGYTLFNAPYSQFIRPVVDFRYYYQLTKRSKIATRITAGLGYALGNSDHLPYIKQFSAGGSNSLRAFPARSVGPGTYDYLINDSILFIDQRGDIKLEANVEYRFDLIGPLKGALFADAGNIWTLKDDGRDGGQFNKDTFLKQIAVGTGVGLRMDFSFFVLRFDLAFPIRKVYPTAVNEDGDPVPPNEFRWAFNNIDFSSKNWRSDNLIFNIAIGYPF